MNAFSRNPQIQWLGDTFAKAGLKCWLDFGTLLGYVRNGDILKKKGGFEDLDLAIFADQEEELRRLESVFRAKGYRFYRMNLHDGTLMYKIFPEKIGENSLAIDIGIYRRQKDEARFVLPNMLPSQLGAWGKWKHRLKAKPYTWALRLSQGGFHYAIPSRQPEPGSLFGSLYSYKVVRVPVDLIDPLQPTELGLFLPARSEDYLAHRYGDWRTPKPQWNFWTDQLDIHEISNEELKVELTEKRPTGGLG